MSRHGDIRDAVRNAIAALDLAGVEPANVITRRVPFDRNLSTAAGTLPAVVVCAAGVERENDPMSGGTNTGGYGIGYPVTVAIHESAEGDLDPEKGEGLEWRQQIVDALIHQGLTGVTGVHRLTVEFGQIVDPTLWKDCNLAVGVLTVWAWMQVQT